MGEAKRKKAAGSNPPAERTWAKGSLRVEANGELCFEWTGTRADAADLQRRYLNAANSVKFTGLTAKSLAKRVAGYLMMFGMPRVGDPDQRPGSLGAVWQIHDIALYRAAVVWMTMQEFVASEGRKIEELFVGSSILVMLEGDRDQILKDTLHGHPFGGHDFKMIAAEIGEYLLDLDEAIPVSMRDLCTIMGRQPLPEDLPDEPVYVPRIPRDADEAGAMLQTLTVLTDTTKRSIRIRDYAGYTNAEMLRGQPAVLIKNGK